MSSTVHIDRARIKKLPYEDVHDQQFFLAMPQADRDKRFSEIIAAIPDNTEMDPELERNGLSTNQRILWGAFLNELFYTLEPNPAWQEGDPEELQFIKQHYDPTMYEFMIMMSDREGQSYVIISSELQAAINSGNEAAIAIEADKCEPAWLSNLPATEPGVELPLGIMEADLINTIRHLKPYKVIHKLSNEIKNQYLYPWPKNSVQA